MCTYVSIFNDIFKYIYILNIIIYLYIYIYIMISEVAISNCPSR